MTSQFNCPACGMPLNFVPNWFSKGEHLLYCAYGQCENKTANNGAIGATEQQAFDRLKQAVEEEQEKETL